MRSLVLSHIICDSSHITQVLSMAPLVRRMILGRLTNFLVPEGRRRRGVHPSARSSSRLLRSSGVVVQLATVSCEVLELHNSLCCSECTNSIHACQSTPTYIVTGHQHAPLTSGVPTSIHLPIGRRAGPVPNDNSTAMHAFYRVATP